MLNIINKEFFYKSLKISSNATPDASPVGLRFVGLLPCAVWAPKAPKPTISSANTPIRFPAPYTVPPTLVKRVRGSGIVGGGDPAACRCSNQHQQQATSSTILNLPQPTVVPTPAVQPPIQPVTVTVSNVQPQTIQTQPLSTRQPNSMLLVPFAVPGFVPAMQPNGGIPMGNPNPCTTTTKVRNY